MSDDEDPSLLVVVVDVSVSVWKRRAAVRAWQDGRDAGTLTAEQSASAPLDLPHGTHSTFEEVLNATLLFIESYLLMHRRNDLCFIAATESGHLMLYPHPSFERQGRTLANGEVSKEEFHTSVFEGLHAMSTEASARLSAGPAGAMESEGSALAGALSQGLCYANRKLSEVKATQGRVLLVQAAKDNPEGYNAIMNCIFSAQKAQMMVDCLVVGQHSTFLQQAAYLTDGVYTQTQRTGLLQVMITNFLPSRSCRKYLKTRRQATVDFTAACFCHRKVVEVAWVCSVCLSVFCEFSSVCQTCGTRAKPRTLKHNREQQQQQQQQQQQKLKKQKLKKQKTKQPQQQQEEQKQEEEQQQPPPR